MRAFPTSVVAAAGLAAMLIASGCAHRGVVTATAAPPAGATERGVASWYGEPYHGRRTASGEVYNMHDLTAAHRTLPFGTRVRVERRDGDRQTVEVRINDRGPFIAGRIIDLSLAAARRIGLDRDGVAPVEVRVLGAAESKPSPPPPPPPVLETSAECYWVQVGAFAELDNARRARERLEGAGEPAVVLDGPNGLMRVRIGPLTSRDQADAARRRIAAEWPEALVRPCG